MSNCLPRCPSLYLFTLQLEKYLGTDFQKMSDFNSGNTHSLSSSNKLHIWLLWLFFVVGGGFFFFFFFFFCSRKPPCDAFLFSWVLFSFLNSGFPFSPSKSSISLNGLPILPFHFAFQLLDYLEAKETGYIHAKLGLTLFPGFKISPEPTASGSSLPTQPLVSLPTCTQLSQLHLGELWCWRRL